MDLTIYLFVSALSILPVESQCKCVASYRLHEPVIHLTNSLPSESGLWSGIMSNGFKGDSGDRGH